MASLELLDCSRKDRAAARASAWRSWLSRGDFTSRKPLVFNAWTRAFDVSCDGDVCVLFVFDLISIRGISCSDLVGVDDILLFLNGNVGFVKAKVILFSVWLNSNCRSRRSDLL